jgi:hypothetical protein
MKPERSLPSQATQNKTEAGGMQILNRIQNAS